MVDNESTDNTVDLLKSNYFSGIELIEAGKNLGFGQANNIGIKKAMEGGASYIFLLNQDAWVEPDTLSKLIHAMKLNKILGIASPIHLNGSGNALDHHFYNYFIKSEIGSLITSVVMTGKIEQDIIYTKFVNAAAWLLSKDCVADVGGFDQLFFHYGEDRNFAHRVIYRGYQIGIVTNARIFHDREARKNQLDLSVSQKVEFDMMNFKVDASNIRRSNIHWYIGKRITLNLLKLLINLVTLKFDQAYYNSKMLTFIISAYPQIMKSRRRSYKRSFQF